MARQKNTVSKKTVTKTESKVKGSSKIFAAYGVNGEVNIASYQNEEYRVDDLTLNDYRRMMDNDGQLQMLVNAIWNTILAAGVEIVDDKDYLKQFEKDQSKTVPSKEKLFLEKNLFTPSWKGGMSMSLELINRIMLRAFIEGFRCFEVIMKLGEDGMIYLDKLAPRAGKNEGELLIIPDDSGDFKGIRQRLSHKGKTLDITIENAGELHKVINVVYGQEFGSLYGRSGLKAAYYHYDKAHKGMYLNHVAHELGAIKFRYLKTKTGDEDKTNQVIAHLNRVGMVSTIALPESDYELTFEEASDPGVMKAGLEVIQHHTSQMAKSVLAQFIDLGSEVANTGSRALGESQTDFFKIGLEALARVLIEDPWNLVISDLIKLNFNNGIYPTLNVKPLSDDSISMLMDSFTKLIEQQQTVDSIGVEIQEKAAQKLNLNVSRDTIVKEVEEHKKEQQAQQDKEMQMQAQRFGQRPSFKAPDKITVKAQDVNLEDGFTRDLYPDEKKVKLDDISRELSGSTINAEVVLKNKLQTIKDNITRQYIIATREGKKSIGKVEIKLAETDGQYTDELYAIALRLLNEGKRYAANELQEALPVTSRADQAAIMEEVDAMVEEQTVRLKLRLSQVANNGLNGQIPENQIKVLLNNEFDSFFSKVLAPTLSFLIPKAFNKGRKISFDKYDNKIFAFRYTAVLDERTTAYCRALDGKIFQKTDPDYIMLTPPQHFGCRSTWTPITIEEANNNPDIQIDGRPDGIPVYGSISSFKDAPIFATQGVAMSDKPAHSDDEIENKLKEILKSL